MEHQMPGRWVFWPSNPAYYIVGLSILAWENLNILLKKMLVVSDDFFNIYASKIVESQLMSSE